MLTLKQMTEDWRIAVGSDSGLGDKTLKYDLRGEGIIFIDQNSVSNENKPADLTISGSLATISGVLQGTVNPTSAMIKGKLSLSPISMAMQLQSTINALQLRLPKHDAVPTPEQDLSTEEDVDHPLPPPSPEMRLFAPEMFDHLRSDSFKPMAGATGLLIRDLEPAAKYTDGAVVGRVLKAAPDNQMSTALEMTVQAPKSSLLIAGWARYEFEGLGETRVEQGNFWYLPTGNQHRLIEVSSDYEVLELEYFKLAEQDMAGQGAEGARATADMFMPLTENSYQSVPNFDAALLREVTVLSGRTGGGADAVILKSNPPHSWVGTPWHMHHQDIQLAYLMKGEAHFEFEGAGMVTLLPGTFWFQQPFGRHREKWASLDFEGLNIDMPLNSPATLFIYNDEKGAYEDIEFENARDVAANAMLDVVTNE